MNSKQSYMGSFGVLVRLRYCQAQKMIYELGNYAIFLFLLLIIGIAFTYYVHRDEDGSQKLFLLLGLLILVVHQSRKDKVFVLKHISNPYIEMMLEYLLMVSPFLIFGIYFFRWSSMLLLLVFICVIPYINVVTKQEKYSAFIKIIPASLFEWKSGVRKVFWPFVLLYLAAIASSWFKILPLILMWLLTTLMMSFYDENESMLILGEYETNHTAFIKKKIVAHAKLLLIMYVPLLIVNVLFNPDYLLIVLLFLAAQITLLVFAITTKYKNYVPNTKLFNNSNFTALMALFGALPGFFLMPLVLTLFNYKKAIANLKPYFEND